MPWTFPRKNEWMYLLSLYISHLSFTRSYDNIMKTLSCILCDFNLFGPGNVGWLCFNTWCILQCMLIVFLTWFVDVIALTQAYWWNDFDNYFGRPCSCFELGYMMFGLVVQVVCLVLWIVNYVLVFLCLSIPVKWDPIARSFILFTVMLQYTGTSVDLILSFIVIPFLFNFSS